MNFLSELIATSVYSWPQNIALKTRSREMTYQQLWAEANSFANTCIEQGLNSGDRVCIFAKNSCEAVVSIIGTNIAGGVFVCIPPESPVTKVLEIMKDCNCSIIISDEQLQIPFNLKGKIVLNYKKDVCLHNNDWTPYNNWIRGGQSQSIRNKSNIASIIYTSGSTGRPKGIISTNSNIIFTTEAINKYLQNKSNDKILSYLPLSFDYGLYQVFIVLSTGATLYLRDSKMFAGEIKSIILEEGITGLPGLRSLFGFFSKSNITFSTLRYLTNTGDSLPTNMIENMKIACPNADIFLMYGLTECKRVSYLPPSDLDLKPESVGIPLAGTKVHIINDQGTLCKPMEHGELYVSGPHICNGYWDRIQETNATFIKKGSETYLKTGDIFYKDGDGYLYYVSRKDNMFKSKGYRIEPSEIENALLENFEEINDVIVVGIPDELAGNRIGLMVILKNSNKDKEKIIDLIKSFCKEFFESWKQPTDIVISDTLPLTSSGKINRKIITDIIKK